MFLHTTYCTCKLCKTLSVNRSGSTADADNTGVAACPTNAVVGYNGKVAGNIVYILVGGKSYRCRGKLGAEAVLQSTGYGVQ